MAVIYIGVDPGVGGGIAAVDDRGSPLRAVRMPETERDVLDVLRELSGRGEARAVLERVWSSPQQGVASAFTFGRNYGAVRLALVACEIPFDEVTPMRWQAALGCLIRGRGRRQIQDVDLTAKKNAHKRRAQELFPAWPITHAVADALLLAEYARRIDTGRALRPPAIHDSRQQTGLF